MEAQAHDLSQNGYGVYIYIYISIYIDIYIDAKLAPRALQEGSDCVQLGPFSRCAPKSLGGTREAKTI
jgi:hypothetical protein